MSVRSIHAPTIGCVPMQTILLENRGAQQLVDVDAIDPMTASKASKLDNPKRGADNTT